MFGRILIANRGEIALRIIRACQELEIGTVVVYSEADRDSLHVEMADQAFDIGLPKSYLDQDKIIAVAKEAKVEAIHPGYGFLSENADFARKCESSGIVFIGPPAEAIQAMGDKSVARETMKRAGVPIVPGSEGAVADDQAAASIAREIGYPVLVKAAAGGGGRGMRIAGSPAEISDALRSARVESQSCFGSGEVYIEKFLDDCRHIEVQILADSFGNVTYLGERDCSIQRRNQKLIEEAPALVLTPEQRQEMGAVSVAAAKAVNYVGAGTIEFLYTPEGRFYFMEMNTRVQVEHPVTEFITGIDIVKEQICVAAGHPLSFAQEDIAIRGHAIECRINAEDPEANFMPYPGLVTHFRAPGGFGVRVDSAVYSGYNISPYYDSMVGKLIVWGNTRIEAIQRMKRALREFIIEGVPTTIPFHLQVLRNEHFLEGNVSTNFIRKYIEEAPGTEKEDNRISMTDVKRDHQKFYSRAKPGGVMSPEVAAVISAAVSVFGDSRGRELEVADIQPLASGPGQVEFSPWRVLGLHQLMMDRIIRR